MLEDLKREIAKYSNLAYQRGLVGAAGGNVSARYENLFLITAGGKSLRDVIEEDIIIVDKGGNIIEGKEGQKPSKETSLHINVYKNRPITGNTKSSAISLILYMNHSNLNSKN